MILTLTLSVTNTSVRPVQLMFACLSVKLMNCSKIGNLVRTALRIAKTDAYDLLTVVTASTSFAKAALYMQMSARSALKMPPSILRQNSVLATKETSSTELWEYVWDVINTVQHV